MEAVLYKTFSALSLGMAFSLYAVGIAIAFRWIKFPDLTGDGSFALGGVVTARLIAEGWNVWAAMPVSIVMGILAGACTASMHRYLRVPKILAGVLTLMGLYSINLRILGQPNLPISREHGVFSIWPEASGAWWALGILAVTAVIVVLVIGLTWLALESREGLLTRVAGANPRLASSVGVSPRRIVWGLAGANGLIALAGTLIAQRSYRADVQMGTGQIIVAVAALFIGMTFFRRPTALHLALAGIFGSCLYMVLIQIALEFGLQPQDFRLVSTLIVLGCIVVVAARGGRDALRRGADAFGVDLAP